MGFSICSVVVSEMTLMSIRDLEVIRNRLSLLPAKLYRPRVDSSRVTCYAYGLFT